MVNRTPHSQLNERPIGEEVNLASSNLRAFGGRLGLNAEVSLSSNSIIEISTSKTDLPTCAIVGVDRGVPVELGVPIRDSEFSKMFTRVSSDLKNIKSDSDRAQDEFHRLYHAFHDPKVSPGLPGSQELYQYAQVANWLGEVYEAKGNLESAQSMFVRAARSIGHVVGDHVVQGSQPHEDAFAVLGLVATGLQRVNGKLAPSPSSLPVMTELIEHIHTPFGQASLLLAGIGIACKGKPSTDVADLAALLAADLTKLDGAEFTRIVPACIEALSTLRSRNQAKIAFPIAEALLERVADLDHYPTRRVQTLLGCIEAFRSNEDLDGSENLDVKRLRDERRWRSADNALAQLGTMIREMPLNEFVDMAPTLGQFMLERAFSGAHPSAFHLARALLSREAELVSGHPQLRVQILGETMETYRALNWYDNENFGSGAETGQNEWKALRSREDNAMHMATLLMGALREEPFQSHPEFGNAWRMNVATMAFENGNSKYAFAILQGAIKESSAHSVTVDRPRKVELRHEVAALQLHCASMALDLCKLDLANNYIAAIRSELHDTYIMLVQLRIGVDVGDGSWPENIESVRGFERISGKEAERRIHGLTLSQAALQSKFEEIEGRWHYLNSHNGDRRLERELSLGALARARAQYLKFEMLSHRECKDALPRYNLTPVDHARILVEQAASVSLACEQAFLAGAEKNCEEAKRLLDGAAMESGIKDNFAYLRELKLVEIRQLRELGRIQLDQNMRDRAKLAFENLTSALDKETELNQPRENSLERMKILLLLAHYYRGRDPHALVKTTDEISRILEHHGDAITAHPAFEYVKRFLRQRNVQIPPGEGRNFLVSRSPNEVDTPL